MLSESHSPETTSSVAKVEPSKTFVDNSLPSSSTLENPTSNDNAQDDDNISSRRKINKQKSSSSSSERHDSPQEITAGNCLVAKGEEISVVKIDTPKKRFFDLKRTAESASNKLSSISPSRFAKNLTPKLRRKSATNHKLSQLEQQSNLFIRDGSESKINKQEMEKVNMKDQQNSPEGIKSKKSSLIPSFNFKISSSSSNEASPAKKSNGGDSHKTGTNFRNLCKNFSSESKVSVKQRRPEATTSDAFANYEEIDILNEDENVVVEMIINAPDVPNDNEMKESSSVATTATNEMKNFENFSPEGKQSEQQQEEEFNSIESCGSENGGEPCLSKPEFSSSLFKNIPVRVKKGQVPHLENYCLFDPSVDFCNEKELIKKNFPFYFPHNFHVAEEKIKEQQQQQLVYDVSEHDERLAHHNYYEIDPELLEQDEAAAIDHNRIESNKSQNRIPASRKSSSSSSCDYPSPSLFNSVIETTPSSTITIESTDDYESNAYRKLNNCDAANLSIPSASEAINQTTVEDDGDESALITISSIVTATGARKKSPQFDRIVKQMARNLPNENNDDANQLQTTSTIKAKSTRINLPFYNKSLSFDPLKASHSLPQLGNIVVEQQIADGDFNIEINNRTTIHLRRRVRPMSSESLDSGFTTPSPPNETLLTQSRNIPIPPSSSLSSGDNNQADNLNSGIKEPAKNESTVLTQCDNIQQLIEVSDETVVEAFSITQLKCTKLKS
jgi:hypothetical protein